MEQARAAWALACSTGRDRQCDAQVEHGLQPGQLHLVDVLRGVAAPSSPRRRMLPQVSAIQCPNRARNLERRKIEVDQVKMSRLQPAAQRVQDAIRARGFTNEVVELSESTRTAVDAAEAIGCHVAQIAKSIVFRRMRSGLPLLVVASGINRVDEIRVAERLGESLGKADAQFVLKRTGFVIGGVPPLAHTEPLLTLIDEDLFQYDIIWAAAGHPRAVFQLTPDTLVQMTGGRVVAVK